MLLLSISSDAWLLFHSRNVCLHLVSDLDHSTPSRTPRTISDSHVSQWYHSEAQEVPTCTKVSSSSLSSFVGASTITLAKARAVVGRTVGSSPRPSAPLPRREVSGLRREVPGRAERNRALAAARSFSVGAEASLGTSLSSAVMGLLALEIANGSGRSPFSATRPAWLSPSNSPPTLARVGGRGSCSISIELSSLWKRGNDDDDDDHGVYISQTQAHLDGQTSRHFIW